MKHILLSVFFCCAVVKALAQPQGINAKDIIIQKEIKNQLPPATRTFRAMELSESKEQKKPVQIEPIALKPFSVHGYIPSFAPEKRPASLPDKLTGNYVKAGFGNYITPYLEGYFNSTRNPKYLYGINFKHLSSWRGPVDKHNSGVATNRLHAYGSKYTAQGGEISADILFDRLGIHHYGYVRSEPKPKADDIKRVFTHVGAQAGYALHAQGSMLAYKAKAAFYHLSDAQGLAENNLAISFAPTFLVSPIAELGASLQAIIAQKTDETGTQNRNLILLHTFGKVQKEMYQAEVGAKVAYNPDSTDSPRAFMLFPALKGTFTLVEGKINLFGSIDGDLQQRTVKSFVSENPFIAPHVRLAHTNTVAKFLFGVQASPEKRLAAKAQASYAWVKNMPFFVNSTQQQYFDILYEKKATGVFEATASVGLHGNKLKSQLELSYFQYNLPTLPHAWHKPSVSTHWTTTYTFGPHWQIGSDLYMLSGIKGRDPVTGGMVKLPHIIDLNIRGEYMFGNKFSFFLELNNILSKKYQRYLYYKVKGINFLIGAAYRF